MNFNNRPGRAVLDKLPREEIKSNAGDYKHLKIQKYAKQNGTSTCRNF